MIGAGASGLACARDLQSAGLRVLVVEARNRIGGRAHTIYGHAVAEAGAEFVHGEHAATWGIIRENGLCTDELWHSAPVSASRQLFVHNGIAGEDPELSSEVERLCDSLYDYQGEEITAAQLLGRESPSETVLAFADRRMVDIESADLEDLSALLFSEEESLASNGSRNFWLTDGYGRVMEALAKDLAIVLSQPVQLVEWGNGSARVVSQTGVNFIARRVVVTIPVGVMRENPPVFAPELPPAIVAAFHAVGFGNSTKFTAWLDGAEGLPEFRILHADGLFGHFWIRRFGATPVIVGFSGGSRADELTAMGERAAIDEGLRELSLAFGRGLTQRITAARHFTWSDDPYARGSYSYPALGMGPARQVLREPLADTLYYTGEAVHGRGHSATVHGAIETGRMTAALIARLRDGSRP